MCRHMKNRTSKDVIKNEWVMETSNQLGNLTHPMKKTNESRIPALMQWLKKIKQGEGGNWATAAVGAYKKSVDLVKWKKIFFFVLFF